MATVTVKTAKFEGATTCPYKDFNGQDIHEGATLVHPSGQRGQVIFYPDRERPEDQWVVDYYDSFESRLCLQVGDKGHAIVTAELGDTVEIPEELVK